MMHSYCIRPLASFWMPPDGISSPSPLKNHRRPSRASFPVHQARQHTISTLARLTPPLGPRRQTSAAELFYLSSRPPAPRQAQGVPEVKREDDAPDTIVYDVSHGRQAQRSRGIADIAYPRQRESQQHTRQSAPPPVTSTRRPIIPDTQVADADEAEELRNCHSIALSVTEWLYDEDEPDPKPTPPVSTRRARAFSASLCRYPSEEDQVLDFLDTHAPENMKKCEQPASTSIKEARNECAALGARLRKKPSGALITEDSAINTHPSPLPEPPQIIITEYVPPPTPQLQDVAAVPSPPRDVLEDDKKLADVNPGVNHSTTTADTLRTASTGVSEKLADNTVEDNNSTTTPRAASISVPVSRPKELAVNGTDNVVEDNTPTTTTWTLTAADLSAPADGTFEENTPTPATDSHSVSTSMPLTTPPIVYSIPAYDTVGDHIPTPATDCSTVGSIVVNLPSSTVPPTVCSIPADDIVEDKTPTPATDSPTDASLNVSLPALVPPAVCAITTEEPEDASAPSPSSTLNQPEPEPEPAPIQETHTYPPLDTWMDIRKEIQSLCDAFKIPCTALQDSSKPRLQYIPQQARQDTADDRLRQA